MKRQERIGHCDSCGSDDVNIGAGWTTRNNKKCVKCMIAESRAKARPVKKITDRQKVKFKDDSDLNAEIWATRPHVCEECQTPLPKKPVKTFFSHLLSKGAHPELRHDPDNIVLHCRGCHNKWEFAAGFRKTSVTYNKHLSYIESHSLV